MNEKEELSMTRRNVNVFLSTINKELQRIYKMLEEKRTEIVKINCATDLDDDTKKKLFQDIRLEMNDYRKDVSALYKTLYDLNMMPEFMEDFVVLSDACLMWMMDHNRFDHEQGRVEA